jgi:hypothetical protein
MNKYDHKSFRGINFPVLAVNKKFKIKAILVRYASSKAELTFLEGFCFESMCSDSRAAVGKFDWWLASRLMESDWKVEAASEELVVQAALSA